MQPTNPFRGKIAETGDPDVCITDVAQLMRVICLGAFLFILPTASLAEDLLSRQQLQADITQTYDILKRYHPNFTTHTSKAELDALHERLLDSVPEESTKQQAFLMLTELVGAVCDEHTIISQRVSINNLPPGGWPWFEWQLIMDEGRLYLEDFADGTKEEVLSINDMAGAELVAELSKRLPRNGCADQSTVILSENLPLVNYIFAELIGTDGPFTLMTQGTGSSDVRTRKVNASSKYVTSSDRAHFKKEEYDRYKTALDRSGLEPIVIGADADRARIKYRYSEEEKIAYVRLGSFERSEEATKGIDLVMRDIVKKNPKALIVDLTGNGGGYNDTGSVFMAYLLPGPHRTVSQVITKDRPKKRPANFSFYDEFHENINTRNESLFRGLPLKNGLRTRNVQRRSYGKPDYKGKLYVLVNTQSYSMSTKTAANLKRLRDATIVGATSATNTVTSCSGALGKYVLPNTRSYLYVPEVCYRSPENSFNEKNSLVPDIPVEPLDHPLAGLNAAIFEAAMADMGITVARERKRHGFLARRMFDVSSARLD